MSSHNLDLGAKARRDLRGILRCTRKTWGDRQEAIYADRMNSAFEELRRHPQRGRVRDDVSPGLRGFLVGEHIIYYRVADDVIRIVRIFHQKMNVPTPDEL